jgi:hypothetical protein
LLGLACGCPPRPRRRARRSTRRATMARTGRERLQLGQKVRPVPGTTAPRPSHRRRRGSVITPRGCGLSPVLPKFAAKSDRTLGDARNIGATALHARAVFIKSSWAARISFSMACHSSSLILPRSILMCVRQKSASIRCAAETIRGSATRFMAERAWFHGAHCEESIRWPGVSQLARASIE